MSAISLGLEVSVPFFQDVVHWTGQRFVAIIVLTATFSVTTYSLPRFLVTLMTWTSQTKVIFNPFRVVCCHGQWRVNHRSGSQRKAGCTFNEEVSKQFVGKYEIMLSPRIDDDVIKWKHFARYCPFVRGSHRWIPLTKASDAELWHFLWSVPE